MLFACRWRASGGAPVEQRTSGEGARAEGAGTGGVADLLHLSGAPTFNHLPVRPWSVCQVRKISEDMSHVSHANLK